MPYTGIKSNQFIDKVHNPWMKYAFKVLLVRNRLIAIFLIFSTFWIFLSRFLCFRGYFLGSN
jgi:hypothetical protein